MDVNHVDEESGRKQNIQPIFSTFSNLFSEKGRNGKVFLSLVNSISDGGFTVGSSSNLKYSVKRFVRGISSAHLYPQCASFAGLTCFLKHEITSAEQVLDILEAESKGNFSKSEQGAMTVGCALACGAIVQSGVYPTLSTETKQKILTKLINASKAKNYLPPVVHRFLVDIVQSVDDAVFRSVVWPICKKEIKAEDSNVLNNVFLIACHNRFPQIVDKFILKINGSYESFIEQTLLLLVKGQTHCDDSIYETISQELVNDKKILIKLWTNCVNSVNRSKSSRDSTLISLFYFILKNSSDNKVIPKLLLPKFIEILIIILSFNKINKSDDVDCHTLARSALDLMVNNLIKEEIPDVVRFKTIEKLMFYPANMKFEKKTGTKCIQALIMHLNSSLLKDLTEVHQKIISGDLKKVVDEDGTNEDWNNNEKQYALHIFVKLLHHSSVKSDREWRLDQIKFLFDAGFIRNFKLHSSVQKCAKDCFYKAVEIQMSSLESLVMLLDDLIIHVNNQLEDKVVELSESSKDAWKKAFDTIQKLKKSKDKKFIAVHLLLIHMALQLFSDSHLAEFNITELLSCYERLKNMKNKNEDDEELHWTEVTVDLMLSLLSRDNKLWRYVVSNLVFPQMVKHITPSALHQIIDVLNPESGGRILNDDQSDPSSEEEEEEAEDEEENEEGKSESSLTESEGENVTLNDQFRMAVKDALGMSAALTDQESVDMDDMNEEEERKLNERLAAAFKMFKPGAGKQSKKQTKEEKALIHFRFRVLDLIEIYLSNCPSLSGCLDLMFPLFNLLELSIKDPNQKALQHRVDVILKKLSGVKKFSDTDDISQKIILDHFNVLLSRKEVPSMLFVEMSPRISECCAFLVRSSQILPSEDTEIPLVSNYIILLENFFHSRDNKLPITLFQSVLRSVWHGNWKLISRLFDLLVDPGIKLFKKMKMIELLEIFYKNSKLHASCEKTVLLELNQIENQFVTKFTEYLSEYQIKKVKTNEKMFLAFFTKILSLIGFANQSFKRHRTDLKKPPQWRNLIAKMTTVEVILSNKKCRKQLGALANGFDVKMPEVSQMERQRRTSNSSVNQQDEEQLEEEASDDEVSKKRRKSKKLSAEKAKLKKESLKLREAMCNDGIDLIPFSSVDVYSLKEDEDGSEIEDEPPISKKRRLKSMNGSCVEE